MMSGFAHHAKTPTPLPDVPGVKMLRTNSDLRIFFNIDGDTITVRDVAKRQAIMTTAGPKTSLI